MLSGPSFRLAFVFSINSHILPGFPLTFFDLAEASISAFSWLYTLVCAGVQKFTKCVLFTFIQFLALILQSTFLISRTWKRKQTIKQQPHRAWELHRLIWWQVPVVSASSVWWPGTLSPPIWFIRGLVLWSFLYRSSSPEVFLRKGVLKICSKYTGEHLFLMTPPGGCFWLYVFISS